LRKARRTLAGESTVALSQEEFQKRNLQVQELQIWQGILGNFSQMSQDINSMANHVSGLFDGINSLNTHVN